MSQTLRLIPVGGLGEIGKSLGGVRPIAIKAGQGLERGSSAAGEHMLEKVEQPPPIGEAEHRADGSLRDRTVAFRDARRDGLVEHREPVAYRALRGSCDQRQRGVLGFCAFLLDDAAEVRGERGHVDAAQVEALAA